MAKKETKKVTKVAKPKVPKKLGGSKKPEQKFQLLTYTIKAIIPTGMYSNIQPEVTVAAETLEQAERAVMPHIEALFTKYRSDSSILPQATKVEAKPAPVAPSAPAKAQDPIPGAKPQATAQATAPEAPIRPVEKPQAPVELSVPFQRAEAALKSCTSKEALKIIEGQITKSVKLTQEEKNTLIMMLGDKAKELNG